FCTSVSGVALTAVKRPGAPPTLMLWLPLLFALIETTSKAGVCAETATTKRNGTSRRRISRPPAGQAKTGATNGVYNRPHVHLEALIDRTCGRRTPLHRLARLTGLGRRSAQREGGRGSTKARSAAERPSNSSRLSDSHRSASQEPRAGQLARDSAYVRWLGLQPAQPDHDRKRQSAAQSVEHPDRRRPRPRGGARRQQRRDVHHHAEQPGA